MSSKITILSLLFCLMASAGFAQKNPVSQAKKNKIQAVEEKILSLEEAGRQKALRGENNWDDLIAEGAYMIAVDGSVINYQKGQNLPSLPLKAFNMTEMIVRVYGEVAIVTGLAEIEGETPDKKPVTFKMRFLNTWKKFAGDEWKIVVSERTAVRPPPK